MQDITQDQVNELTQKLAEFSADPLGFVLWNYPWGEPGTELEKFQGPDDWQRQQLIRIGNGIITIQDAIAEALKHQEEFEADPIREATTSGHGIGKSAEVCWILDWAQSTCVGTKGIVTANTERQLITKTWAEMAKWQRLGLSGILFRMTATARFSRDPELEKEWRIDVTPWSEKNTEAFAGLHNKGKRIILIFDEASAIPDIIWETAEGALTDKNTEIIWCVYGNPTKNTGRFRECFDGGKFTHRWRSQAIDSRDVEITNKKQLQEWIDDYGEDHDFVRVRVRGMFPKHDATSFISLELVREAIKRVLPKHYTTGRVLGVDVARYGDNASVIYSRRGRDGRSIPPRIYQGLNTLQLAHRVYEAYIEDQAVAIFVDGGGVGGGVVDQLEKMGTPVYEVQFSSKPEGVTKDTNVKWYNRRAEIWGATREWLEIGCIPDEVPRLDHSLEDELTAPTYTYLGADDKLLLESKKDMRRRQAVAVDVADALALTFSWPALEAEYSYQTGKAETYTDNNPLLPLGDRNAENTQDNYQYN